MQIDLELARRILRDRGGSRHLLRLCRIGHIAHEIGIDVEAGDGIKLARVVRLSGRGRDRRQRLAQRAALAVRQIEFHFRRDHGREAALGKARQQPRQHLARIDQARLVLLLRHGQHHLRRRLRAQGTVVSVALDRPGIAVGVAAQFRAAAGIEIFAGRIEEIEAERQLHAAIPDLRRFMHRKALAARIAVHVRQEGVEMPDAGIGFQEAGKLAGRIGLRSRPRSGFRRSAARHDDPLRNNWLAR